MNSTASRAAGLLLGLLLPAGLVSAQSTWSSQYKINPWDTARLTAADIVGPDGIVYPDWTGVGVSGGIPDINNSTVRSGYSVYDVTAYGAVGDGVTNADAAVAAAAGAAKAHAASGGKAILYFPAGTFLLTQQIVIDQSRVVVDGAGRSSTVIKLAPGGSGPALLNFQRGLVYQGYIYPTANIPRGARTVTFDQDPAAVGYTVGGWVRMLATAAPVGSTMRSRYSKPDNFVDYTDPMWHFGRLFLAKVQSINSTARTITFDRSFPHDFYSNETPQLRVQAMLEGVGVQDLTIETTASNVALAPVQFARVGESWLKNVRVLKAANHPVLTDQVARVEFRDCAFDGTWADINNGSNAYLGWTSAMDALMENCTASDLRHMAIFQMAARCVVRNSTFTGKTVQSPQLHGRFPLENLVENSVFSTTTPTGTTRALTAYGIDWANSLRHGPNGPRNVFYGNRVDTGAGALVLGGANEGLIVAYNRVLKTDDNESWPFMWAADRTFDVTLRGNIAQAMASMPALNLEDPTCTGWDVSDNVFHGTNGKLWAGDSSPELISNNRQLSAGAAPGTPAPEVASIYAWQRSTAATPRVLLAIERRALGDNGESTTARVVRVSASTGSSLTVGLSADQSGLSFPASVTIPAGATSASFTLSGTAVSGERAVTLTASASGLLSDPERVAVLDLGAPPALLTAAQTGDETGLPAGWRKADQGKVAASAAGTATYSSSNDTWTLQGAGAEAFTYMGTLARAGRFGAYQTVAGDGEIRARFDGGTGYRQTGLLIADDEAPITEFIWVEPSGRVFSSGFTYENHAKVNEFAAAGTVSTPVWLRLKRAGSLFTAYRSTATNPSAESDWTVLATINFYQDNTNPADYKSRATLDPLMHYGMFVNSGSETTRGTATFSGVQISGQVVGIETWAGNEINTLQTASTATWNANGDAITIAAAGLTGLGLDTGTVSTADAGHFYFQALDGDGSIVARLDSYANASGQSVARAAVMIRDGLAANARHASLAMTGAGQVSFIRRTTTGGTAGANNINGLTRPRWLRLTRVGNTFTAAHSSDGVTWTQVGNPTNVTMGAQARIGLFVTSRNATIRNTAVFSEITVQP